MWPLLSVSVAQVVVAAVAVAAVEIVADSDSDWVMFAYWSEILVYPRYQERLLAEMGLIIILIYPLTTKSSTTAMLWLWLRWR